VSLISPYAEARARARAVHEESGLPFIEVWVSTPLEECERRDPKGLYARARRGEISGMTGIDDPYEPPAHAEIVLETLRASAEDNARRIVDYLASAGFVRRATVGELLA
jgi:bifunctional enzyme CysN/CysC